MFRWELDLGGTGASGTRMLYPVRSIVTDPYGQLATRFHAGIDLAAAPGTQIIAPAAGRVTVHPLSEGWQFGVWVCLDHEGTPYYSAYAHMLDEPLPVRTGQVVAAGTTLGRVGSTGLSTGPHTHWAVSTLPSFPNDQRVIFDPMLFAKEGDDMSTEERVTALEKRVDKLEVTVAEINAAVVQRFDLVEVASGPYGKAVAAYATLLEAGLIKPGDTP
jgi:murein DD-endopeptidase MepM/ murein hydrolase activator NlpD